MNFFQAIIISIVQGLTEFLPVSSSGHIVLVSSIYKYFTEKPFTSGGSEEVFFDIMIHVGTLIAVIIYFRRDLADLTSSIFKTFKQKTTEISPEIQLLKNISIATIATIIVVYPLKDYFEADMSRPAIVGLQIFITGVLIYASEFFADKFAHKNKEVDWKKAVLIGIAQGIAVSPGISRSASTIATGVVTGVDRVTATRFSFLASIPIIIIVALYDGLHLFTNNLIISFNWRAIIIGTVVSTIVGYFCIKYFILYISKHKLNVFGAYCLIMGFAMFLFFNCIKC